MNLNIGDNFYDMDIYVDGSTDGTNIKGCTYSYAAVVVDPSTETVLLKAVGVDRNGTNQTGEIRALQLAFEIILTNLDKIKQSTTTVNIYSDSMYVVNTINEWLDQWIMLGRNKAYIDWWKEIRQMKLEIMKVINLNIRKVKGHSKNKWNNMVDKLARNVFKELV